MTNDLSVGKKIKCVEKVWQSCIELRIHFKKGYWYKICKPHLKDLDEKKFGWTIELIRSQGGCDIPWCKETLAHEVYPTKDSIVSFWKPRASAK